MAADQRKRRPSLITTPLGCGIQDQYRTKKREFRSLQGDFNYDSHVSLKWDDNEKMVVAKEDQIGISSRHLALSGPVSCGKLADVISVPKEAFELDDLTEVLTYEDWQLLLTESDRIFLAQFLPRGFNSGEVVKALFGCENFHFGNPFLKWGSSLCSGDLHPDAIVQYEKSFKANKKSYYYELQQYHDNMIRNLKKLKDMCVSSKEPESEFLKIMSSISKGRAEKNVLPESHGFNSQKTEANATKESTSSIADDKSYYSDNQKLSVIRDAEIQRRIRNQEITKNKPEKSSSSPNGLKGTTRPRKAEKSQKANITFNDGTKYMSYMTISKKQHEELVESMGQSCSVVQPKNLNRLLGNLDSYNVKPYVMFGEEAQKRIHEHWANLVKKDLPEALEKWRRGQLERLQIMGFLCQELEDKLGVLAENGNEKLVKPFGEGIVVAEIVNRDCQWTSKEHHDNKSASQGSISDGGDKPTQCSSENETSKQNLPPNINPEFDSFSVHNPVNEFDPPSIENQSLQNPSLNIKEEFDPSSTANQSLQNPPSGTKKAFDKSSIENQSLQNPSLNIKDFDPSSLANQSLQNTPSDTKEQLDKSSTENQSLLNPTLNVKKEFSKSSMQNQSLQNSPLNINNEFDPSSVDIQSLHNASLNTKEFYPSSIDRSLDNSSRTTNQKFDSSSVEHKLPTGNPPFEDNQEFDPMDLNAEDNQVSLQNSPCSPPEHHVGQTSEVSLGLSHTETPGSASSDRVMEMPLSSVTMWSSMDLPESYGHSHHTTPLPFSSSNDLTLRHPQLAADQTAHLIVLDHDPPGGPTKTLLNRHTNPIPFTSPYATQVANEQKLQSLIQRDRFHLEQQKTASVFHPANALLEPNPFPGHIPSSSFALDHKQRIQSGIFTNQIVLDNIYSDSNRYSLPSQEHISAPNVRDWGGPRMPIPIQSELNHSWLGNDNRAHSRWSAPEGTVFSTAGVGSGGGDQSLFSVLSQCNSLQPRGPLYNLPGQSEQMMIPSTSYGHDLAARIPMTSNALPRTSSPFDYLSGGEASATATLKNPILGWMGLGNQPSALQDPSGKPFVKPWDQ